MAERENAARPEETALRRIAQHAFAASITERLEAGDGAGALRRLAAGAILTRDPDLRLETAATRGAEGLWSAGARALFARSARRCLPACNEMILDPTGRRVALDHGDGLRLYDAASGAPLGPLAGDGLVAIRAAFSADGVRLLVDLGRSAGAAAEDGLGYRYVETRILAAESLALDARYTLSDPGYAAFSPRGDRFATEAADRSVRIWDAETGAELGVAPSLDGEGPAGWAWAADGQALIELSADGALLRRSIADGAIERTLRAADVEGDDPGHHSAPITSVAGGAALLLASEGRPTRLIDAQSGAVLAELPTTIFDSPAGVSPDRTRACLAGAVYALGDGAFEARLERDGETRWGPSAFSADGQRFAAAAEGRIGIYDAASGALIDWLGPATQPYALGFSQDGATLLVHDGDGVRLLDTAARRPVARQSHGARACGVAFAPPASPQIFGAAAGDAPAEDLIASIADGRVRVWRIADGGLVSHFGGEPAQSDAGLPDEERVLEVAWRPDRGALLARCVLFYRATLLRVVAAEDGSELCRIAPGDRSFAAASWTAKGHKIATLDERGGGADLSLWSPSTGRRLGGVAAVAEPQQRVDAAAFRDDGSAAIVAVAAPGEEGATLLWADLEAGAIGRRWATPGAVEALAWSAGGAYFAVGLRAGRHKDGKVFVEIYDAANLERAARLDDHMLLMGGTRPGIGSSLRWTTPEAESRRWAAVFRGAATLLPACVGFGGLIDAASPDGALAADCGGDRILDPTSGAVLLEALVRDKTSLDRECFGWSPSGAYFVTADDIGGVQVWDARRLVAFDGDRAAWLAAALSAGVGERLRSEAGDPLMAEAPPHLYEAYVALAAAQGRHRAALEAKAAALSEALRAPAHPSAYLAPSGLSATGAALP